MDFIGSQMGPYRVYEKIGTGGFATVYLGRDIRTNQVVAIKVLHPHLAQNSQFIARFRHEAEALQKIPPHPNIVRLHEFGQQEGTYYLAMDYLEGKDLAEILAERKCLPVNEALDIATQIAQALDVAHQHGLVHRDIKPSNIRITPQGVVKVMDFGIARATEGTLLTLSGMFVGTPEYIAPEIWEGKPADIRSDLYALGVLLYELLTGVAPFRSDTPAATMRRHLTELPRAASAVRADVPAHVDAVIAKMMAKDPDTRYQTPAEVIAVFQHKNVPATATVIVPKMQTPAQPPLRHAVRMPTRGACIGTVVGFGLCVVVTILVIALFSGMSETIVTTQATTGSRLTNAPTVVANVDWTVTRLPSVTLDLPTNAPTVALAIQATSTKRVYPAPTWLSSSSDDAPVTVPPPVVLRWSFPFELANDEWFEIVATRRYRGDKKHSLTWTKGLMYEFRVQLTSDNVIPDWATDKGDYCLAVKVIRGKDGKWSEDQSPESKCLYVRINW